MAQLCENCQVREAATEIGLPEDRDLVRWCPLCAIRLQIVVARERGDEPEDVERLEAVERAQAA
jgi:hypothetical protein